jgi:fatty-acid desaturase
MEPIETIIPPTDAVVQNQQQQTKVPLINILSVVSCNSTSSTTVCVKKHPAEKKMWENRQQAQNTETKLFAYRYNLRNKMLLGWGSSILVAILAAMQLMYDKIYKTNTWEKWNTYYLSVFLCCFAFASYVDNAEALRSRPLPTHQAPPLHFWRNASFQHYSWIFSVLVGISYPFVPNHWRLSSHESLSAACVWIAPGLILKLAIGMSALLHRFVSHRAYEPRNRLVQFILIWLACMTGQSSPLFWGAMHNRHHKHCDSELDPHSPQIFPFWYAWVGWTVYENNNAEARFLEHLWDFPELQFLHQYYWIPLLVEYGIIWNYFGFAYAVYGAWLPSTLCALFTLLFNVRSHYPAVEEKPDSRCQAFNIVDIGAWAVGESAHLDHHHDPKSFHRVTDVYFGSFDFPYYLFIKPLILLRVVSVSAEYDNVSFKNACVENFTCFCTLMFTLGLLFVCSQIG